MVCHGTRGLKTQVWDPSADRDGIQINSEGTPDAPYKGTKKDPHYKPYLQINSKCIWT